MTSSGYACPDPKNFRVTDDMKRDLARDGYVLVKFFLSVKQFGVGSDAEFLGVSSGSKLFAKSPDGEGRKAHIVMWNHPGVDVTGMVARCEKVAGSCEQFLGGEVYHYHTKLMKKPARIGGRHMWHQDFGYWYLNGCLFPDMMTVFIAIDKTTKQNSCLQVLKGSHKCGRIDHVPMEGQMGADVARVDDIAKVCPLVHVEMDPGDALFFHCNLLHCSSANLSDKRRWAFLCAYNKADNDPVMDHHHPRYTPLEKVDNSAILACQDFTTMDGKWFADTWFETRDRPAFKLAPTEQ